MNDDTMSILLTDRRPVQIRKKDWPAIVDVKFSDYDGEIPSQANRTRSASIVVRASGSRRIVYGKARIVTNFRGERDGDWYAGYLVNEDWDYESSARYIALVANDLQEEIQDRVLIDGIRGLVAKATNSLPPEILVGEEAAQESVGAGVEK